LLDFDEKEILPTDFRQILRYQISRKSVQWECVVLCGRIDRRTDMTKLIVAFRNFANASKNETRCCK